MNIYNIYIYIPYTQLADITEKQKELQQQHEQEKILKNILAVTTEPPHVNSYVYVNFFI